MISAPWRLQMGERLLACGVVSILLLSLTEAGYGGNPVITAAARTAAEAIRREALLPPDGPEGKPLPLVSHWNMGSQGKGWTPEYQTSLLNEGHHILPWFGWPRKNPFATTETSERFEKYYVPLLSLCSELGLPISFRGTQWEAMLVRKEYRDLPPEESPAVVTPGGEVLKKLDPFGPVDLWRIPAGEYVDTPAMKRLQEVYPEPPLVLFVSNNEAPDLRWHEVEKSKRYIERYGTGRSGEFRRRVVSEGWMKRYPVMFQSMRESLVSESWKKNSRFVGYGAFGPSHLGRMPHWPKYSLTTEEWTSPWWYVWDGGSPSYYTHRWSKISGKYIAGL